MTKFKRGDDVLVDFGGLEHRGCVLSQSAGYVMARIVLVDPESDYGDVPWMDPEPTVCVKETKVRLAHG